jgi:predicted house-cleaning noncanonical NTP pyrophosphatase (MazG superfamily)
MVSIKLDKERYLLRTLRGMKLFEDKTGKSMLRGFDINTLTNDDVIAMLWSLLIHEDKELTIEQTEELTEQIDAMEVVQKIIESLGESTAKLNG